VTAVPKRIVAAVRRSVERATEADKDLLDALGGVRAT
jgi:hypothetical protein